MTENNGPIFFRNFALFLRCFAASIWRHFMPINRTKPPLLTRLATGLIVIVLCFATKADHINILCQLCLIR